MATSRRPRLPWSGNSPREIAVFAGAAVAGFYGVLIPVHLALLTGTPRVVMAAVAAASAGAAAAIAVLVHRGTVPDAGLPLALAAVASLPLVNSLTHTAVTAELHQTAVTMLSIVAIAAVAHARLTVPIVVAALVTWAAIVAGEGLGPPSLVRHYGFGLLFAVLLSSLVHEVIARTRRRLSSLRDHYDAVAAVARCGRAGEDPRPVVLDEVLRLAGASSVAWVEPDGRYLVAVLSAGKDVTGARVPLESEAATSTCWATGARVFVPDTAASARIDAALVALTGSVSTLAEPVMHDDEVLAVLVVGWTTPVTNLADRAVAVVSTLAAEAGAAVAATRLRAQLQAMATTDPMTGLANRRGWQQRVNDLALLSARTGAPLTLAMADLDHFKQYNDTHGHDAGDALLQAFARTAVALLRDVDVVARWGGEEFAIALPGSDETTARVALERLRLSVPEGQTCSFGLATWDRDEAVTACLSRADAALYRAKAAGRDRVAL
jgi:diguanylate cyclase (GGDEF)-like protein